MSVRSKLLALALLTAVAACAGVYTWASFVATSKNDANSIASGTVILSDNDGSSALLSLTAAQPGATDTGGIKVTYGGTLPATVRLYGTTTGSGLDQYLNLTVTRGIFNPTEPAFDSCTNFQADATNYVGAGAGVVYSGTLQGFPDGYAGAVVDPTTGLAGVMDDRRGSRVPVSGDAAEQLRGRGPCRGSDLHVGGQEPVTRRLRSILAMAAALCAAAFGAALAYAAFVATTSNSGNSFQAASCFSMQRMASGSYVGDGVDNRVIAVGFQPNLVIVKADTAQIAVSRSSSHDRRCVQADGRRHGIRRRPHPVAHRHRVHDRAERRRSTPAAPPTAGSPSSPAAEPSRSAATRATAAPRRSPAPASSPST